MAIFIPISHPIPSPIPSPINPLHRNESDESTMNGRLVNRGHQGIQGNQGNQRSQG